MPVDGGPFLRPVPLVEFIYLLFIRMPGELSCVCVTSFERQLTPLLVDSATRVLGLFLFQIVSVQL